MNIVCLSHYCYFTSALPLLPLDVQISYMEERYYGKPKKKQIWDLIVDFFILRSEKNAITRSSFIENKHRWIFQRRYI